MDYIKDYKAMFIDVAYNVNPLPRTVMNTTTNNAVYTSLQIPSLCAIFNKRQELIDATCEIQRCLEQKLMTESIAWKTLSVPADQLNDMIDNYKLRKVSFDPIWNPMELNYMLECEGRLNINKNLPKKRSWKAITT